MCKKISFAALVVADRTGTRNENEEKRNDFTNAQLHVFMMQLRVSSKGKTHQRALKANVPTMLVRRYQNYEREKNASKNEFFVLKK